MLVLTGVEAVHAFNANLAVNRKTGIGVSENSGPAEGVSANAPGNRLTFAEAESTKVTARTNRTLKVRPQFKPSLSVNGSGKLVGVKWGGERSQSRSVFIEAAGGRLI